MAPCPSSSYLIDITLPFSERLPVWPGDVPVQIRRTTDVSTVSELRMSSHVGTHLDAPAHFLPQGRTVEQLPLETLIGPAWLADVGDAGLSPRKTLDRAGIPAGVERLLLKTMNSASRPQPQPICRCYRRCRADDPFDTDFVAIDQSAARWLLDRHIPLVGIDGPSIELYRNIGFPGPPPAARRRCDHRGEPALAGRLARILSPDLPAAALRGRRRRARARRPRNHLTTRGASACQNYAGCSPLL